MGREQTLLLVGFHWIKVRFANLPPISDLTIIEVNGFALIKAESTIVKFQCLLRFVSLKKTVALIETYAACFEGSIKHLFRINRNHIKQGFLVHIKSSRKKFKTHEFHQIYFALLR